MKSVYACHSDTAGPLPRGRPTEQWMQAGWVMYRRGENMIREPVMKTVRTDWLPIKCGALQQVGKTQDINCAGCANRSGIE